MANSNKNIVITPNIGSTTNDPKIVFSGADANTAAQNITATVYPTNNGTLSFDGSVGQLFSITNSLTGTIFSVNDISGIPSIEVLDTGTIRLAQYSGNIGIGMSTPVNKLDITGTLGVTGQITSTVAIGTAPFVITSTTPVANLSIGGNAATATSAPTLTTTRSIYGNNFNGSADLTQIIASNYGGTGNGFTKFTGPATAEKTFTLPNSNATLLYDTGPLGTPSGGTVTNLTGTASININGTVGATTPTTGVFTTATITTGNITNLTATNDATISGLTIGKGNNSILTNTAIGVSTLPANTTAVATFGAITPGSGYTNGSYVNVLLTYVSGATAPTYPRVDITVAGGAVTACTLTIAADGSKGGTGFTAISTVMSCASIGPGTGFAISPATLATGQFNTAIGYTALQLNTTGSYNTATGYGGLRFNTTGVNNTANGHQALWANITGNNNTGVGAYSLMYNTTGGNNTGVGYYTLTANTTGSSNTGLGYGSLYGTTTGSSNTSVGLNSLALNVTGNNNTAVGYQTIYASTTSSFNTAIGYNTFYDLKSTSKAITAFADYSGTVAGTVKATSVAHGLTGTTTKMISGTTNYNGSKSVTFIDVDNFYFTATWVSTQTGWWSIAGEGDYNTAIGYNTGRGITTGSGNTIIGANITGLASTLTNNIILANSAGGIKAQHDGTDWTLTGKVNVASQIISTLTTGTSPLTVASTTKVANLNTDLFDDQDSTYYRNATNINAGILAQAYGGTGSALFVGIGSVTTSTISKTLVAGEYCTFTVAALTATLPASPTFGMIAAIGVGNFVNTIIGRNSQPIMSLAEDMTINNPNTIVTLMYVGSPVGWQVLNLASTLYQQSSVISLNNIWTRSQRSIDYILTSTGASIAIDFNYENFYHTTTENTTLAFPTNMPGANQTQSGVIKITQGATPRTMAFASGWTFPDGYNTLTASGGAINVISYMVISPTVIYAWMV